MGKGAKIINGRERDRERRGGRKKIIGRERRRKTRRMGISAKK